LASRPFASLRRCAPFVLRVAFGVMSDSEDYQEPSARARVPAKPAGAAASVASRSIMSAWMDKSQATKTVLKVDGGGKCWLADTAHALSYCSRSHCS
jgi:hypothetical protein